MAKFWFPYLLEATKWKNLSLCTCFTGDHRADITELGKFLKFLGSLVTIPNYSLCISKCTFTIIFYTDSF